MTSYDGNNKPAEVQRSYTSGGVTTIESLLCTYLTSGNNNGLLIDKSARTGRAIGS